MFKIELPGQRRRGPQCGLADIVKKMVVEEEDAEEEDRVK